MSKECSKKLYIIPNSHIDPVWIWSRNAGRYNWLNTAHSVVAMMRRHPELTFSCSSSAMYRFIEETSPLLFKQIRELVEAGRWEIVGGWEVQSDAIVSETESLIRQGIVGKKYFKDKFGVDVTIGYCVDSFGHSVHLPKIFNATGFSHYVFLRPMSHQTKLPYLFDWRSEDGSQVRALRIFDTYSYQNCCKEEYMDRIAEHIEKGLDLQTLFIGTGDHGGGIYEKHFEWLQEASETYDMHFSTLKEYFEATDNQQVPLVENCELGPVFRGCYSANYETKAQIAQCSSRLCVAEKCGVAESVLEQPWRELLFHNFHDVLSGTAAYLSCKNDIMPALGGILATAENEIAHALCRRSESLDTSFLKEGGVYLWNAENKPVQGIIGITGYTDPNETGSDFNALVDQQGTVYPLQIVFQTSSLFSPCAMPWGKLTAIIPMGANEEKILAYTRVDIPQKNIGFEKQYRALKKIQFLRFHDDSGTWGFDLVKYIRPIDIAAQTAIEEFADGPVCSILRATYKLNSSTIRLDLCQFAGVDELKLSLRIDWQEKLSVLKLAYAWTDRNTTYFTGTPGGEICRHQPHYPSMASQMKNGRREPMYPCSGENSMMDWCAVFSEGKGTAFYAADLHSCDYAEGALRMTLLRTVPYADHHPFTRNDETGYQDMGLQFRDLWLLTEFSVAPEALPQKARSRLANIESTEITAHPACGNCQPFAIPVIQCSDKVILQSARRQDNGKWLLHLMNYGAEETIGFPNGESKILPAKALRIVEY